MCKHLCCEHEAFCCMAIWEFSQRRRGAFRTHTLEPISTMCVIECEESRSPCDQAPASVYPISSCANPMSRRWGYSRFRFHELAQIHRYIYIVIDICTMSTQLCAQRFDFIFKIYRSDCLAVGMRIGSVSKALNECTWRRTTHLCNTHISMKSHTKCRRQECRAGCGRNVGVIGHNAKSRFVHIAALLSLLQFTSTIWKRSCECGGPILRVAILNIFFKSTTSRVLDKNMSIGARKFSHVSRL